MCTIVAAIFYDACFEDLCIHTVLQLWRNLSADPAPLDLDAFESILMGPFQLEACIWDKVHVASLRWGILESAMEHTL